MNQREAILSGVKAATEMLDRLDIREAIDRGCRANVDIFGSIIKQGACLLFRPLEGLLGACIGGPGVIISTNRSLPIQRFIASHEFCHVAMHHSSSFDGEEILNGEVMKGTEEMEIQANAFAAEFLLPRWLFSYHGTRQGWNRKNMEDPACVYQLSLRVGASYEATVRSLEKHKIISQGGCQSLLDIAPRDIKQKLLPGYTPENWHRDVWHLTQKDQGAIIEGQPDDLFRFQFNEKTGAGYLWDFETLKEKGFVILNDERAAGLPGEGIGMDVTRLLTAHSPAEQTGELHLALRRPWQKHGLSADQVQIQYNLLGKERGIPRAERLELARAA